MSEGERDIRKLTCSQTIEFTNALLEAMKQKDIEPPPILTPAKILDHLGSIFIEPQCIQPTFLVGHPELMSPLAKSHPSKVFFLPNFLFTVSRFSSFAVFIWFRFG